MKAIAVFPRAKRLETIDAKPAELETPSQVRVRVLEVGVCGTDREIASFQYGQPPEGSEYLIVGHESLGEVAEIGSSVEKLVPGDLVVASVRRPCGQPGCTACASGNQDFCYTGLYKERGIKQLHGYMAETYVEEERYLYKLPRELAGVGVLTEPLTIGCKALRQVFEVQERLPWSCSADGVREGGGNSIQCRRALVLGAGPVGLLGAMLFAEAGFETIVYSRLDSDSEKLDIVKGIGSVFVRAEEVKAPDLRKRIGSVDAIYEATGASQLAFEVLATLGPNAVFVFTGVPGRKAPVPLDTSCIMQNLVLQNQILLGTVNAAAKDYVSAAAALGRFRNRWPGLLERLKTGSFAPEQAPKLLANPGGIKNVVVFSKPA